MYKSLVSAKPLRIRFNNIDEFIRVYDGTRYLVLFGAGKCDLFYNKIRYLIGVKSGITYVISFHYAKIKADSYAFLPLEKSLSFHNVIILITSVSNKDKNHYYYNIVFETIFV